MRSFANSRDGPILQRLSLTAWDTITLKDAPNECRISASQLVDETSLSLLNNLRGSPGSESWDRLVKLYSPLLRGWLRRYDLQESDAEDLVQDVLLTVAKELGEFDHSGRTGAFRAWLKMILVHRLRNFWRTRNRLPQARGDTAFQQQLNSLEDPNSPLSEIWNREHDQHVALRLLVDAERAFTAQTWEAFRRVTLEGQSPQEVAADLDVSLNAVFIAKSRVLRRLRQQADGLLDESGDFFQNH